ncbi:lytic transglycosylase domain-containing protein [Deinococcus saxicola]|uniref:lytic transglycosylase domain-containing protein n=1 Tax=Deinococcus saxicola TaxID=249406 RepID=UPI0039F0C0B6
MPTDLLQLTHQAEAASGLPADLLVSLVWAESRYCPAARSSAGAVGLGQLMPLTARDLGFTDRTDPAQNLWGSARYLRWQWNNFRDWNLALLAYHDGAGNVQNGITSAEGQRYAAFVLGTYSAIRAQGGLVRARR